MTIQLKKIDDYRWEIPISYKEGMRVPGIIYTDETLLKAIQADQSIEQVANGAFLPGILKASLAMPDMHFGYGLPIGGVVATDINEGVVSPGGTGYDINCGVRFVRSNLLLKDIKERVKELVNNLYSEIPTGVGSKGKINLSREEESELLIKGARWAVERGYGTKEDLEHTEANGCLEGADPDRVVTRAYGGGRSKGGPLGSGNHFLEIQYVDEIYDKKAASI